jgi:hypothetical protein
MAADKKNCRGTECGFYVEPTARCRNWFGGVFVLNKLLN